MPFFLQLMSEMWKRTNGERMVSGQNLWSSGFPFLVVLTMVRLTVCYFPGNQLPSSERLRKNDDAFLKIHLSAPCDDALRSEINVLPCKGIGLKEEQRRAHLTYKNPPQVMEHIRRSVVSCHQPCSVLLPI